MDKRRKCVHSDEDGKACPYEQIYSAEAISDHSYAGFAREGELPKLMPKRPGWQCENGHSDEVEA
jgi:hypothetical protein